MATEVVELAAPPPPASADNSGEEWMVAESVVSHVVSEPQVRAASGGDDIVMVFAEQAVPSPSPTGDHEAVAPAVTETPALVTTPVGGGCGGSIVVRHLVRLQLRGY
jgi:hypothetical protein